MPRRVGFGAAEITPPPPVPSAGDAAKAASGTALPATLSWRRAALPPDVSLNRRGHPYEPSFSVLDAMGADGARIGSLSNLAIHPVALGPECLAVSADWVGPFRQA